MPDVTAFTHGMLVLASFTTTTKRQHKCHKTRFLLMHVLMMYQTNSVPWISTLNPKVRTQRSIFNQCRSNLQYRTPLTFFVREKNTYFNVIASTTHTTPSDSPSHSRSRKSLSRKPNKPNKKASKARKPVVNLEDSYFTTTK